MSLTLVRGVVRSICSNPAPSTSCTATATATSASVFSTPLRRHCHQRRQSSSKTSVAPPAVAPSTSSRHADTAELPSKSSVSRSNRRKSKSSSTMTIREKGYFPTGVPAVPPTNHLEQKDIGLSSFYSQHRPISLTTSTPPSSSTAAFNKLFEERPTAKNIHLMDANQASFYQSFEDKMNSINVETTDLELQSSGNASRRETRPTVEEIVASKTPYIPPPPPTSQIERTSKRASASRKKSEQRQLESVPRQISYKTTILLTGSVYANGKWTFTASTSPLEKVPTPTSEPVDEPRRKHQIKIQQPFLERMMIRQRSLNEFRRERTTRNRGNMLLISVKRQRKLKMKKHKYKKLMKRTRTLRRKLDRL